MSNREFIHLVEKWKEMNHKEQITLKKIAELEGVSYGTVRRYFKRYDIEVKDNSVKEGKRKSVEQLIIKGYKQREISKITGTSRGFIKKVAESLNINFVPNKRHEVENEAYFEEIDAHRPHTREFIRELGWYF